MTLEVVPKDELDHFNYFTKQKMVHQLNKVPRVVLMVSNIGEA